MPVTGSLDAEARRAAMSAALQTRGTLQLNEEAAEQDVHPMTIRRDFDAFVAAGLARRVRGGVVAIRGDDFDQRRHHNSAAKRQISTKLRDFVSHGITIGLDSSTTVHELTTDFAGLRDVTVVTNGLAAFQQLTGRDGVRAFLTGGEREEQNLSLVGSLAVQTINQFSLDIAFVSTMCVDLEFGTSELTMEQVSVKKALVEAASTVVLAVDSTKFQTRARFRSLPLESFDVLVTELPPGSPILDPYREIIREIV